MSGNEHRTAQTETNDGTFPATAGLIAVTIGVGEKWRRLAELAAESVRLRTGLATHILGEEAAMRHGVKMAVYLKLKLFEEFPDVENILYFDADTIFLQDWNPRVYADRREIVCVRDRWQLDVVEEEARRIGFAPREYFNAGFFLINRTHHRTLLERAEWEQGRYASELYEQTDLNAARHLLGLPALFLPKEYNYLDFDTLADPSRVVVGHFAAIDRIPLDEVEPYFRSWLGARRVAPDPAVEIEISHPRSPAGFPAVAASRQPDSGATPDPVEDGHRVLLEQVVAADFPYPAERFAGRGIVICGGGVKYFPCTWVCVNMLRHLGCTLPVEVWHLGEAEMDEGMRALLAPMGVEFVDGHKMRKRHPVRTLHGWEMKAYALLHCRFAEVLLLDADNVAVRDPAALFEAAEYRRTGAVFWPDFGRLGPERSIWALTGVAYRDEPEFESGQILVDKARCWHALQVAMHLNEYSDFYYHHIHGDKETFHLAWRKLGQEYAMPARGIEALEATMCQHDFAGVRLFQHRNFDKWNPWVGNRRVHDFLHEEQCFAFCAELAARWDPTPATVRRYRAEKKSAPERAAAARLAGRRFDYHRVGHDRRPLQLLPDGRVGEGAAGCELFWDVCAADDGRVRLEIFSDSDVTMRLEPNGHDLWRGRWLRHECMPIELTPLADD